MNFKQLQNEALAIELLVKYQPIIDDIITLSEGVGVMSEDDRLHWISSHALKRGSDYFFVEWEDAYIKGLEYVNYDVRNCRVQKIESTQEDDENNDGVNPIKGKEDIEKLIDGTPDFIITIDKEQFDSFETNFCTSIDSTTTIENITSALPEYSGGGINIYNSEIVTANICNPIMFDIEDGMIAIPDVFSSYVKYSKKKKQD